MRSSGDDNSNRFAATSSSKCSSSSSSPAPFSPSSLLPTPYGRKTMEEVWKDVSLTSLQGQPPRMESGHKSNYRRSAILQEFLARPFRDQHHATSAIDSPPDIDINAFASNLPPPPPPPPTVLSLDSGPEFQFLDTNPFRSQSQTCYGGSVSAPSLIASSGDDPFDFAGSSLSKRRMPESADSSADRRHKRMIKNRESAARSRARKQAYTNELELEVARLLEENAKLRKQPQQAAASASAPRNRSLQRTLTAPF